MNRTISVSGLQKFDHSQQSLSSNSSFRASLSIGKKLGLSFGAITLLLMGVSGYSIYTMNRLAGLTHKLYDHPYQVTTSVLRVEKGVIDMHRSVKDAGLAQNQGQIEAAMQRIDELEQEVLDSFAVIESQFLGDQAKVEQAKQLFLDWKPIRDNAIALGLSGNQTASASITRGEGTLHLQQLVAQLAEIEDFATNKATEFSVSAEAERQRAIAVTLMLVLSALGLTITLSVVVTRMITRSLREAVHLNNQLAEGDLNLQFKAMGGDEVGQLLASMQHMVGRLSQFVVHVKSATEAVMLQSQEMSASAAQLSSGAIQQAASTEETARSIERMFANFRDNAQHAHDTEAIAQQATLDAGETRQAMLDVIQVMNVIIERISIVEEIAQQTNLLALNASIESVKVESVNNGFSVIATEIRKLAEHTRNVTANINDLAQTGMASVNRAEAMLNKLLPSIRTTAQLVQKINVESTEQLHNSAQINDAIQQLDGVTQQNTDTARELSQVAHNLSAQAEELQHAMTFFRAATV